MTGTELIAEYFPGVTDDEADYILWNQTAFPFGNLNYIREQLARLKDLRARFPSAPLCETCNEIALREQWCIPCWLALTPEPRLLTNGSA